MANERRRLIDATKLDILGYLEEFPINDEDKGWNAAINSVFAHVVCAPTVDAIIPVRCKDCKWYKTSELFAPKKFCYRLKHPKEDRKVGYYYDPDGFCSYGERKSGTQPQRED